ncbi:MAG: hypothetical protein NWE76_02620, partial [Candidatus Bathyarchaeota archaeon]|nr:hypothetical protein [Candidatus Bathyarchaeota archaeon]
MSSVVQEIESPVDRQAIWDEAMELHNNRPQLHYTEFGGEEILDTSSVITDLEMMHRGTILEDRGWAGTPLSQVQQDWLDQETDRQVNITLSENLQTGTRPFAEPFHRDLTEDIAENNIWPISLVKAWFSPIHYGRYRGQIPEDASPLERSQFTGNRLQWNSISPLMNLARMDLASVAFSLSASGFNEEDFIEVIRSGDDAIYHTPDVIQWYSEALGDAEGETSTTAKWLGVGSIAAALLLSPDIISTMLSAPGMLFRGGEINSRLGELFRSESFLDEMVEAAGRPKSMNIPASGDVAATTRIEPAITAREIFGRLGGHDVATQNMVGAIAANRLDTGVRTAGNTADRLTRSIEKAREQSEAAGIGLEVAEEALLKAERSGEAAQEVAEHFTARVERDRLLLTELDNRRIQWLVARGIPEEKAEKIFTAKEYQEALSPGARESLDQAVTDAERVYEELNSAYLNKELRTNPDAERFVGDKLEELAGQLAEFSSRHNIAIGEGAAFNLSHLSKEAQQQGHRLKEKFEELLELGGAQYRELLRAQELLAGARVARAELDAVPQIFSEHRLATKVLASSERMANRATATLNPRARAILKAQEVRAERELRALRAEDRLVKAENARASLIKSIEEVRDSFRTLRTQLAKQTRVNPALAGKIKDTTFFRSIPTRIQQRAQATRGGFSFSKKQIEDLGLRIDLEAVQKEALELEKRVISKVSDDTISVQGKALTDDLVTRFGAKELESLLKEPELAPLRSFLSKQDGVFEANLTQWA